MYSRILTASLYGLNGVKTWVEVDTAQGLPSFSIVGLANQSVKESKERIHSAILNCKFVFPVNRITVNLTPASKKKDGSHYDLAIALGVLASGKDFKWKEDAETAFLGELSLDGKIAPVDGVLPMLIGLQRTGVKKVILPSDNLKEALLVKDMIIVPATNLSDVVSYITGQGKLEEIKAQGFSVKTFDEAGEDFADIKGQEMVKRAAAIAAAGMHGMLMIGPPGVGKSMIGKRIPGILPNLTYDEQLDITQIYSVAGELSSGKLITKRPFRSPHHSVSAVSLVGGGTNPRPGEVSLAHNGVLFLDELPEFQQHTLETLRQPLEDGKVSIVRVNGKCVYPSRFMLVAAMNPCKCGYFGDPIRPCTCTETDRKRYVGKISGPLLDRIDIHVCMERINYKDISETETKNKVLDTRILKTQVSKAVEIQRQRYSNLDICFNSQLSPSLIEKYCSLNESCKEIMDKAYKKLALSARAYHRVLKVARTIADLDGLKNIEEQHILEALSYRVPEKYFY